MAYNSKYLRKPTTVFVADYFEGSYQYHLDPETGKRDKLTYDARPQALAYMQDSLGIMHIAQMTLAQQEAVYNLVLDHIHYKQDVQSKRKRQGRQGLATYNASKDRVDFGDKYTGKYNALSLVGFRGDWLAIRFGNDIIGISPGGDVVYKE